MSMATAAPTSSASNPLAALGGSARMPDDGSSGVGSSDTGPPSFNSALAAAQSSQPSQGNSGNATQATNSSAGAPPGSPDASNAGASEASTPATVATNSGSTAWGKVAQKGIAARAASTAGAAKSNSTALPTLTPAVTEQTADSSDLQAASDARDPALARDDASTDDTVTGKSLVTDASSSTPAGAAATVSDSVAQALAGLVHQLLAKDTRTAAPVADATGSADAATTALATIAGANTSAARTAVAAASLAQLVLAKSSLEEDSSTDSDAATGAVDSSGQGAASAAALAVAAGTQPPAAAAIPERTISVPVQSSQWPQALGTEIRWLTSQNIQSAVLRLSPDHLGPVQVNISVNASHVSVSFGAAHPDTRAALEQAMPRLRDMLSGAGLTLGEATVQQQSRQASQNPNPAARSLLGGADTDAQPASALTWKSGLVDEYA